MTVKDVIDGFKYDAEENPERDTYADNLFQEAIRISMELNNRYHTPEEIREIMGRLSNRVKHVLHVESRKTVSIERISFGKPLTR